MENGSMKIQIISDVHTEFGYAIDWSKYIKPAADILVLAGDVCYLKNYFDSRRAEDLFCYLRHHWEEIIYVPGNHDFYMMDYNEGFYSPNYIDPEDEFEVTDNAFKHINWQDSNIRIVNNDVVNIGDINLVCSTLWSDIPPHYEQIVRRYLADFRMIGKMNPSNFNYLNKQAVKFIKTKCKELDNVVVVSHHLPSWTTVSAQYKNDPVTHGFANSHLDPFINPENMVAWIHGHSHDHLDININGVRIVRNPFGYLHEQNNGYICDKIIEV